MGNIRKPEAYVHCIVPVMWRRFNISFLLFSISDALPWAPKPQAAHFLMPVYRKYCQCLICVGYFWHRLGISLFLALSAFESQYFFQNSLTGGYIIFAHIPHTSFLKISPQPSNGVHVLSWEANFLPRIDAPCIDSCSSFDSCSQQ